MLLAGPVGYLAWSLAMAARWRRTRPWWILAGALIASPLAALIAGMWLPRTSAVVVGVATAVAGIAAPLADRARSQIVLRAEARRRLPGQAVGLSEEGRMPRVRDRADPLTLGVHPAAFRDGNRVPPFVPRDADAHLREALSRTGFVLLVGESTAGKSRTAYEAMRALLPNHILVQPTDAEALAGLKVIVAEQQRCVVWLDDLERYLGASGLSSGLLTALLGDGSRHVVILATMRTQEHARYDRARESTLDDVSRQAWRRGRDLLERAHEISIDRRWSAAELARAREYGNDPRIAMAVRQAGRFGVAEVLAGGPELVTRLRNAWTPGQHPRAAALVTAAVDCRRARLHRPVPRHVLLRIHNWYLDDRGGPDLRPETVDEAFAFAAESVYGTTRLLLEDGKGGYLAHDYLIDALPAAEIPDSTWHALLDQATGAEAYDLGTAALDAYLFDHASRCFTAAAEAGIRNARYMLGWVIEEAGRPGDAIDILRQVHAEGELTDGPEHRDTLATRYQLARCVGDSGDAAGALAAYADILADSIRFLGSDHRDTLATRHQIAHYRGELGDTARALSDCRELLNDQIRVLGADHPDTLATRQQMAHYQGEVADTAVTLAAYEDLLIDQTRVLGPHHPDTLTTRRRVAYWKRQRGPC